MIHNQEKLSKVFTRVKNIFMNANRNMWQVKDSKIHPILERVCKEVKDEIA